MDLLTTLFTLPIADALTGITYGSVEFRTDALRITVQRDRLIHETSGIEFTPDALDALMLCLITGYEKLRGDPDVEP